MQYSKWKPFCLNKQGDAGFPSMPVMCLLSAFIRKQLDVISSVYVKTWSSIISRILRHSAEWAILLIITVLSPGIISVVATHPPFPQCQLLVLALGVAFLSAAVYCAANAAVFCRSKVFAAEMTWNKFWLREVNHCSTRGLQLFSLTSPLLADRGWFPSLRDSRV